MQASKLYPSLSIVIPVYNSQLVLPTLAERLNQVLPQITQQFEVILVNDGSADDSWIEILRLSKEYNWIKGFSLMRNYGQHNAVLCGIRAAQNGIIVTMDDDLQHPPEEIIKLLAKLEEGFDVVYGKPEQEQHGIFRNILSVVTKKLLASAMGVQSIQDISAFRAFNVKLRNAFENFQSPNLHLDVLFSWGTTRFASVKINHQPRLVGKSNYTFRRLFNQVMVSLTGFSTAPLRLASIAGFVFALFGMFILIYTLGRYLIFRDTLPGFTFLASIIALFSGVQMFALGLIGEYIAKMFNRSMERPAYIVRDVCNEIGENLAISQKVQRRK
ncbi:MAG TPA: glycosyltransferase family 2 protein [Pyrinomonadaceae bacterium]|nr:glycosyltransferase family 2 protein [Pyrinomonadaceae bacterium]